MAGLVFPSAHLQAALPPERFAEEIFAIERELDQLHPPWRQPTGGRGRRGIVGSRGIDDMAKKARVKVLLQRRKHLYNGKDYQVVLRSYVKRDGSQGMIAEPIIPKTRASEQDLRNAGNRSTLREERPRQASLPQIAAALQVPLERVERWVLDCPEGANVYAWARRKKAEALSAAGQPRAAKPKPKPRKKKVRVT